MQPGYIQLAYNSCQNQGACCLIGIAIIRQIKISNFMRDKNAKRILHERMEPRHIYYNKISAFLHILAEGSNTIILWPDPKLYIYFNKQPFLGLYASIYFTQLYLPTALFHLAYARRTLFNKAWFSWPSSPQNKLHPVLCRSLTICTPNSASAGCDHSLKHVLSTLGQSTPLETQATLVEINKHTFRSKLNILFL